MNVIWFDLCLSMLLPNAATVFGQNLRLEPLNPDKKAMWKREMNCLLSVCNYIVEFAPTLQTLQDGTAVEVKCEVLSLCHPLEHPF